MTVAKIGVGVAWVASNLALVFLGRGTFGHTFILMGASMAAMGCGVTGMLLLLFARGSTEMIRAGWHTLALGMLFVGLWASSPFGAILNDRAVAEAKAFCESLRPAIEQHKAETGRYPERPPELPDDVAWPRLVDKDHFYRTRDEIYSFDIFDPSGLMKGFVYNSRTGEWYQWD